MRNDDVRSITEEARRFLPCPTPDAWLQAALREPALLLIDHANCEKKAAATAMSLMHRYSGNLPLLHKMSRLAREELRHFEQVMALMAARGVRYDWVPASRYASGLHALVGSHEPRRLVDTLICGAFIEARSCERFARLAPHLDAELSQFYRSLLRSEARHFRDYLALARSAAGGPIDAALARFADREQELVQGSDTELRFHSGPISA